MQVHRQGRNAAAALLFLLSTTSVVAQTGQFGPIIPTKVTPIHMAIMPDASVMAFGTGTDGEQGAEQVYDVITWPYDDPNSQTIVANLTGADFFCGALALNPSGWLMITGGAQTISGQRNYGRATVYDYRPTLKILIQDASLNFPRWYGTDLGLPDERVAVLGGSANNENGQPQITPEVYDPAAHSWQMEWGATDNNALGGEYYNDLYPQAFVIPNSGDIDVLTHDGKFFDLNLSQGLGAISQMDVQVPPGWRWYPTAEYSPGHLLSLRNNLEVVTVDLTSNPPIIADTAPIDTERKWSSMTVLADGQVLLTGGTAQDNILTGVAYQSLLWNPATGQWTPDAVASIPGAYHSNAILLPDATVFYTRGGAPNPTNPDGTRTNNILEAQIYSPPYLRNLDGSWATRPNLQIPLHFTAPVGGTIQAATDAAITRVTMLRQGTPTHAFNPGQRFLELQFNSDGSNLTITIPNDPTIALPGYYMIFAFAGNVPSFGQIVHVTPH